MFKMLSNVKIFKREWFEGGPHAQTKLEPTSPQ